MEECKECKCPFFSRINIGEFSASPLVDYSLYKQLVESLLYLTHSRPNFSYVVVVVARYMQEPHEIHCNVAKSILHYVQGTKHFGIHHAGSSPLELVGFTDFDWARDSTDKKSTLGYVFMLAHGTTCW